MKNIPDNHFGELRNEKLRKIIKENAISNAYIFHGPENIGKKESALRFIAEIINKNNADFNAYTKLKDNNYPDYLVIEPTFLFRGKIINFSELAGEMKQKTKPLIRIEQIRNIKDFLSKKSIQSEKKFILINDAHLLNESSSNCLLKTLEETSNAVFILLTSRFNLLLDTIISRCHSIRFKPYSYNELKNFLKDSNHQLNSEVLENHYLENLILISNGSPGKLLKNLELWNQIPLEIRDSIKSPQKKFDEVLYLSKNISIELNLYQQEFLLEYMQRSWWNQTKNIDTINILESIRKNINSNVQTRISWEVGLLKIIMQKNQIMY
tara:strand:+ start:4897 stop:5868 length:972 start_codon:yes stop_codon:yes gene_type:complete